MVVTYFGNTVPTRRFIAIFGAKQLACMGEPYGATALPAPIFSDEIHGRRLEPILPF
jgi:hypothetical protein